jgi:hypothetical protein
MRTERIASIVLAVAFLLSGCDSNRLDQFASFAAAGSQYVQAFHKVTEKAGSAMIAVDSAALIVARNQAGVGDAKTVEQNDRALETYLANLRMIDSHANLLGAYFDAITRLANGKAADDTSAAAAALLDSIDSFNPQIEKAWFGDKNVKDYIKGGTNLTVTHFEVKALNDHLKKAAPTIDQALTLQEAAIQAIAEQMKASLSDTFTVRESMEVIQPYVQGPPANWSAHRESFLRTKMTIADVDNANVAIQKLHASFRELVQNRNASIDFAALLNDINKIAGYASAIEASTTGNFSK